MIGGTLTIDQTPCRASYGLFTPTAFRQQSDQLQKQAVLNNIANTVETGNRLAQIWNKADSIGNIAADAYGYHPLDIALKSIDRPIINWQPATGNIVDISI